MTIKEIISDLVKNRWSYGDIAKHSGVSKATISRWHKGVTKPNKVLEKMAKNNLVGKKKFITAKIDDQADVVEYFMKHFEHPIMVIRSENDTIQTIEEIDSATLDKHIAFCEKRLAELKAQKEKNKWKFTEDEKVILRNLPEEYKWIRRTCGTSLLVHKTQSDSRYCNYGGININAFNHLFKCLKNGDEPCEFRKFI